MDGSTAAIRHIGDDERRARLVVRHHLAGDAGDIPQAVAAVVALHASDPSSVFLAARARVRGSTIADVEQALYADRALWRLHAMRRTLWVTTTADAPLLIGAAGQAVAAAERRRLERWAAVPAAERGVEAPAWLAAMARDVGTALAGGAVRTTAELADAVPELSTRITIGSGRWTSEASLASRLLVVMAMEGTIVRTAPAGSWRASGYGWASAAEWFGGGLPPVPPPPEARSRLLGRWLQRFGPGGTDDIRWWFGWTVRQTADALAASEAVAVSTDTGPGWVAVGEEEAVGTGGADEVEGHVAFLPALDPTTMGWKERRWYLGEHAALGRSTFDRNGNAGPTIWAGGRVVGGWAQRPDGHVVTSLFADVGAEAARRIDEEADAVQAWLEADVVVPRFRTPLELALARGDASGAGG